jgi:hypothetical protein
MSVPDVIGYHNSDCTALTSHCANIKRAKAVQHERASSSVDGRFSGPTTRPCALAPAAIDPRLIFNDRLLLLTTTDANQLQALLISTYVKSSRDSFACRHRSTPDEQRRLTTLELGQRRTRFLVPM